MENFTNFTPILNSSPEHIKQYYEDNNLPLWDNPYFNNYINLNNDYNLDEKKINTFEPVYNELIYKTPVFNEFELNLTNDNKENNLSIVNEISNLDINESDKVYLKKLAEKESNFNPNVINKFGYKGLYQFGKLALKDIGFTSEDLDNTLNQHKAALSLARKNEERLKDILNKYEGKEFKGIKITKNGIRAAAHLLGAATVKDWFNNTTNTPFAKKGFVDGNGTHITQYLKMF